MVMYQPGPPPAASGSVEEKVYKCVECDAVRSHREELDENFRCRGCATQLLVRALNAIKPVGCIEAKLVKQPHTIPCSISSCKYNDWSGGDYKYYVQCHEVPGVFHSETSRKYCLRCAEEVFDERIKEAEEALRERNEALDDAIERIHASTRQKVRDWVHDHEASFADLSVGQLVALAVVQVEDEPQVNANSSAMPESMVVSPVIRPEKHKKMCAQCFKRQWHLGEYYVYDSVNPVGTDKFCLHCAQVKWPENFGFGLVEEPLTSPAGASTSTTTDCGRRLPDSIRRTIARRRLSY